MKRWDRRGLEGLPLKLLIMSLLLSLAAPAVLGSLDSFERSTARSHLTSEASRLAGELEELRSAGEGNRRTLTVSLPASLSAYSMALEIGGEVGNVSSLIIRCSSQDVVFYTAVLDDPPARMTSSEGKTLRLEAGEHHVSAECLRLDGRIVIVLSVM